MLEYGGHHGSSGYCARFNIEVQYDHISVLVELEVLFISLFNVLLSECYLRESKVVELGLDSACSCCERAYERR